MARSKYDLTKALIPVPASGTRSLANESAMAMSYMESRYTGRLLPRPAEIFDQNNFGPSVPMAPMSIDRPGPAGYAPDRIWQYPVGYDLPSGPRALEPLSFRVLKQISEKIDIFRICIETIKRELMRADWDIVVTDERYRGVRDYKKEQIREIRQWFMRPDPIEDYDMDEWVSAALDQMLSIDALSIVPRRLMNGKLASMQLVEGSTIKPLLATNGGRPQPPYPAYQQFLYGVPRSEYTQMNDFQYEAGQSNTIDLTTNELLYKPFNRRVGTPWGFPPVEWALLQGITYMRRSAWWQNYFTDSNMPQGFVFASPDWSVDEIDRYEASFNAMLAGDPKWQWKVKFVPHGGTFSQVKQPNFETSFDLFMIKLLCMPFGVIPSELGITESNSMGGRGMMEEQKEAGERRSIEPYLRRFTNLFNRFIRSPFGFNEPDLGFRYTELEVEDAMVQASVDQIYVNTGVRTRRAIAETHGWEIPDDEAMADVLTITTPQGVIPLSQFGGQLNTVPAGSQANPALLTRPGVSEPAEGAQAGRPTSEAQTQTQPNRPRGAVQAAADAQTKSVRSELKAFENYARKGSQHDFKFSSISPAWASLLKTAHSQGLAMVKSVVAECRLSLLEEQNA